MKVGIGQDSHRFLPQKGKKVCIIGGVQFQDIPGWDADSDGDIVYHAICNAVSSITHVPVLGKVAIEMCKKGTTDSKEYLLYAKKTLAGQNIAHIALTIEAGRPRLQAKVDEMRKNIAEVLDIDIEKVGITATSGDHLTDFAKGLGAQCLCILTLG